MPANPLPRPAAPARVVLDTNVVLDLWLFGDRRAEPLRRALASGQLRALRSASMLAELEAVLGRPFVSAWPATASEVVEALLACSDAAEVPAPPRFAIPRCTDPDDQKFIDLAWMASATWLVSRDRAVLKLASAARACGLQVGTPTDWATAHRSNPATLAS